MAKKLQNIEAPRANGRPPYDVVTVGTDQVLEAESAFVKVAIERALQGCAPPVYGPDIFRMPTFKLGSLALFVCDNRCTHAGMINQLDESEGHRGFTFAAWSLTSPVTLLPLLQTEAKLRFGSPQPDYIATAQVDDAECHCRVKSLSSAAADDLRIQIGLDLPEHLLEIYWSDADLKRVRAQASNRVRFAQLVNARLAELNDA